MTKKISKFAMYYMIFGLIAGVFYREFTKIIGFTGDSQLSVVHTHALALGMLFLLIVTLLEGTYKLSAHKNFGKFFKTYNAGLILTLAMMTSHGIWVAIGNEPHAAFSGIAGIGHIILAFGLGYFFNVLIGQAGKADSK